MSDMSSSSGDQRPLPPTRWESTRVGQDWTDYAERFARLHAEGADVDGEARLLDALLPRAASVLDGGCGTGRVTAALHARGHRAVGVDRDAGLVEIARRRYPGARYVCSDLLVLTPELLGAAGAPQVFDLIALPGNVMVFLAPGTERRLLARLLTMCVPGGRLVAGFATDREYTVGELDDDACATGWRMEGRYATWQLDPFTDGAQWAVTVLRTPSVPAGAG